MNTIRQNGKKSIVPLISAVVIGLVIIVIVGYLFIFPKDKLKLDQAGEKQVEQKDELAELNVSAPVFDFSVSPLAAINLSTFNLSSTVGGNLFDSPLISTLGNLVSNVTLAVPTVALDAPTDYNIKQPQTALPAEDGDSQAPPAQSQVTPANCAQFSSVPSCTYIQDANGQVLCNQCKAVGY